MSGDGDVEEIEVRCPVPVQLPSGHSLPGKLLLKLRLAGEIPSYVYPDNLIELSCEECRQRLRKSGRPVRRVLHRFNLLGELVVTLVDGEEVLPGMRIYTRVPVAERFWAQVDRRGYSECWPFTSEARGGAKKQYGVFGLNPGELEVGRRCLRGTHRVAFRLTQGRWPEPFALHGCDNPLCCNAENSEHVHEGTPRLNMVERSARFRDPRQHSRATEAAVLQMVADGRSQSEVAATLGISYNAANSIVYRAVLHRPTIAQALVESLTDGEVI